MRQLKGFCRKRWSLRWRLSLSYAAIALLATLALGAVLLVVLNDYYTQRELDYLTRHANFAGERVADLLEEAVPLAAVQSQLESLSFLTQTHIQIFDADRHLIADSGIPDERDVVLSYTGAEDEALNRWRPLFGSPRYTSFMFLRPRAPQAEVSGLGILEQIISQALRDLQRGDAASQRAMLIGPLLPPRNSVHFSPRAMIFAASAYVDGAAATRRSERSVEMPIQNRNGDLIGYIALSDGLAYGSAILDRVAQGWLIAGVAAVIVAAVVGWFVSQSMSAPVITLIRVTERMLHGDLAARADVKSRDEIGVLARTFNEMAHQVEDTVLALQRFVGDAAHELHTPLTALSADLELAVSETTEANRLYLIQRAREQLKRMETLTADLLDLSRLESDRNASTAARAATNLNQLLAEISEVYASQAEQKGILFNFEVPANAVIAIVNEGQLRRVVANLLDNAIKFTPPDGMISIGLARRDQTAVELWVQDTGIGIPAADLPYLFSRFHRGRNVSALPGSGLGLAIVKAIVEAHDGEVAVQSGIQGTRFAVRLPLMS